MIFRWCQAFETFAEEHFEMSSEGETWPKGVIKGEIFQEAQKYALISQIQGINLLNWKL